MKASEYLLDLLDKRNKTKEDFKYGGFYLEGIVRATHFKTISNCFTFEYHEILSEEYLREKYS